MLTILTDRRGRMGSPWVELEPYVSIVATVTTDDYRLLNPALASRFEKIRWDEYSDADMLLVGRSMTLRAGIEIPDADLAALAGAACGIPRAMRTLVQGAVALRTAGEPWTAAAVLEYCQIAADGLTPQHEEYLRVLNSCENRTAGLDVLTNLTNASKGALAELERALIRRGFIRLTAKGRHLTREGSLRAEGILGGRKGRTRG